MGRIVGLAAGLLSKIDDGPSVGWDDVLLDVMLAMARGQSGYRPSLCRVWSASQDIDPDHDWEDELVNVDKREAHRTA